jgi:hypothetical protein
MVFQIPHYWDVAIDGIQILLCLLILVFLFRHHRNNRRSALEKAIRESDSDFNVQILTQTFKQQIDQAFARIAETIAAEQRNLEEMLPIQDPGKGISGLSQFRSRLHRPNEAKITPVAGDESGSDQLHEQIQQLALKGLSARQISEALKTPLGEVELVLSLGTIADN